MQKKTLRKLGYIFFSIRYEKKNTEKGFLNDQSA